MKRVLLVAATLFCAGASLANPFGAAPARAPQTRPAGGATQEGPIADSPPPPPRSDLGAVVEQTITLTPTTPYVAGRASLRVVWDGDAGGWSSNPGSSITTPMINKGAAYYARAGKSLTWPSYPLDKDLPNELRGQVQSALGTENDPAKLDALVASIVTSHGQKYPLALSALRSKAAALRAQPNVTRLPVTTRTVSVDFASAAKAQSSVVTCHVVHTGGPIDLVVAGVSPVVIANRSAKWVEGRQDPTSPASVSFVVSPNTTDQSWIVDRCLITGYASPSTAPRSPGGSAPPITQAAALPRAAAGAGALPAAAPLAETGRATAISLSPRTPVIPNRAFLSATWRDSGGAVAASGADATNNQFWVSGGGSVTFDLIVDVLRQAQASEAVACEFRNLGSKPANVQGQAIPPNASRWVEVTLPSTATPAWTTAKITATGFQGKLATQGCRIQTPAASPASAVHSPRIRR